MPIQRSRAPRKPIPVQGTGYYSSLVNPNDRSQLPNAQEAIQRNKDPFAQPSQAPPSMVRNQVSMSCCACNSAQSNCRAEPTGYTATLKIATTCCTGYNGI